MNFYISIHAPRTGSDAHRLSHGGEGLLISIHAPRTGSDRGVQSNLQRAQFQSTLPARGATGSKRLHLIAPRISIHAPRTGSDHAAPPCCSLAPYFNPRSPHGERRRCKAAQPVC